MNKNKILIILGVGAALIVTKSSFASVSSYTASDFAQYCVENSSTCKKVNQSGRSGIASCPSLNQTIQKVYVHAGNGQEVYELPDPGFSYFYSNNQNTVTVQALGSSHDLSWIGVVCTTTPTPTNIVFPTLTLTLTPFPSIDDPCKEEPSCKPTVTFTPTLTPIPTEISPTEDPGDEDDHEEKPSSTPTLTPSPTITVTPTGVPTLTPTPTQEENNNSNNGSSGESNNSNSGTGGPTQGVLGASTGPTQAVLGASTMAKTGLFEKNLVNLIGLFGILLLTASTLSYVKEGK